MKNNYPIKYAVIPVYEQVGWSHGINALERSYDVVAYIASKCYVLNEIKQYLQNGNNKTEYEIVPPFEQGELNDEWIRIEPHFGCNRKCTNSIVVDNIYDNYIDAHEQAQIKNNEILIKKLSLISYSNDEDIVKNEIEETKKEHNKILNRYRDLEVQIMEYTHDIKLNEKPKEQSIIVMYDNKDKVLDLSLYTFIDFYNNTPFHVCNISKEEYELMKQQLKKDKILTERTTSKSEINYNTSKYLMINDTRKEVIRIVDYNSDEGKGSFYLKRGSMFYDENMIPFYKDSALSKGDYGIKVYTTETYSDIIKSYIPKYISCNNKIEIKVDDAIISKKLVLKK